MEDGQWSYMGGNSGKGGCRRFGLWPRAYWRRLDRYTRPDENFVLVVFETSGGNMESDSFEEIRDVVGDVLIEAI